MRLLIFVCFLFLVACKDEKPKSEKVIPKESTSSININEKNLPLTYPDNWEYASSNIQGIQFFLFYRGNTDGFKENINLMTEELGPDVDLKSYTRLTLDYLSQVSNKKILSNKKDTVNGHEVYLLSYEADLTGQYLYYYQQYRVYKGKAYVLTFSSDIEDAEKLKSEVEEIFSSFVIPD